MVALKIEDQKGFTAGLFLGELFDRFLVREADIVTFNRFSIDGRVRHGYYSDEELEAGQIEEYSSWKTVRPICYSLIKGKRLPETFRIVLMLTPAAGERFAAAHMPGMSGDQAGSFYLNIQYENHEMSCITGVSLKFFSMDKTLERQWDESVMQFLKKNGIAFME